MLITIRRGGDVEGQMLTVRMPVPTHQGLKLLAVERGRTMGDLVTEAVTRLLKQYGKKA
jgi:predicted DNA-binding protein